MVQSMKPDQDELRELAGRSEDGLSDRRAERDLLDAMDAISEVIERRSRNWDAILQSVEDDLKTHGVPTAA